jgi:hypothetical protein
MSEKLRPRFRYYVPSSQDEICDQFKGVFKDEKIKFTGSALSYHIVIDFLENDRHFWSPQLDLNLEKYEDGTLIRGLIGPRPNVWTVFMFFYAVAGVAGLAGIIIGTGQWSMGDSPLAFWLVPFSAAIFLAVYLIGKTGKKIAYDESVKLHEFLIKNVKTPVELELSDL